MLRKIKEYLKHPLIKNMDIDSPEAVSPVSRIIQSKPFLKQIYNQWYLSIAAALPNNIAGPVLELGSGGGFLHQYIPNLITSEILKTSEVDIVLDAQFLPFGENTLQAIVMLDVFHHLPNAKRFLNEAAACVKPGGAIVMIEPWVTGWSKWIYRNMHHEPFDIDTKDWGFPDGGPLSQANSALPWIIFSRDRSIFLYDHPEWKIQSIRLHTPLAYLLSGGVSMRSFIPGFFFPVGRLFSYIIKPWINSCAMFATIIINRNENE